MPRSGRPGPCASLRRGLPVAFVVALASSLAGCSITGFGGTGGREQCWPQDQPRTGALMKGVLRIGPPWGTYLDTDEGGPLPLLPGTLLIQTTPGGVTLVDAGGAVAVREGETVTLWGGIGADEAMIVCGVEERF